MRGMRYNGSGCLDMTAYRAIQNVDKQRKEGRDMAEMKEIKPKNDPVNRPAHYTDGNIEVIDFIEDKDLDFCLGNAVKYIARAGKKDPSKIIEDLKKAVWYLNRKITKLEEAKS